jgi:hypothetical protein
MCFSPKSNNIEMSSSIPKDTLLHLKFVITKMEKEKEIVNFLLKIAKKMDVSQPPFKSSCNSCMQKRETLKKYVAKCFDGCGILFNVVK